MEESWAGVRAEVAVRKSSSFVFLEKVGVS